MWWNRRGRRVAVIGLDGVPPRFLFEEFLPDLPNIRQLVKRGAWGPMRSTIPAITCPAWMSMMTSRHPGALGCYGFRHKKDHSYDDLGITDATCITEPTVWDILSQLGKRVILLGVTQTYPPKPVNGVLVASFPAPDESAPYTYPLELKEEIAHVVGRYMIDVKDFRTDDKSRLLNQIYEMTDKRFDLAEHLLKTRNWDFFMMVEMGPDRIHHGFWKYCDPSHRQYAKGNPFESAIRDYYIHLDGRIARLLELFGDETTVFIVSDHGGKGMDGGICVNEWLIQRGYLALKA